MRGCHRGDKCRCALLETEKHVFFIWRRKRKMERTVRDLKDGMEEYEIIKGYHVRSEKFF